MTDIAKGLRRITEEGYRFAGDAADEIERLRADLEVSEKDVALKGKIIDALGAALNAVASERDALRAKIERMEKQEPVAKVRIHKAGGNAGLAWSVAPLNDFDSLPLMRDGDRLYALPGAQKVPSVPDHKTIRDLLNESGLCAYDREGDLAFMVAATKFAALAAAPKPEESK